MSTDWINKWVRQYGSRLLAYVMKILGNEQLAQEVVQESFLRLLKFKREDIEGKLPEWLYQVCRNRAIDVLRKKNPVATENIEEMGAAHFETAHDQLEANERVKQLMCEINKLPQNHQELFRLKFQENLSYEQISEITGLSKTNIGFILSNSMKKIRENLALDTKGGSRGKS